MVVNETAGDKKKMKIKNEKTLKCLLKTLSSAQHLFMESVSLEDTELYSVCDIYGKIEDFKDVIESLGY